MALLNAAVSRTSVTLGFTRGGSDSITSADEIEVVGGSTSPELAISADNRYLIDNAAEGAPFLVNSVAAWSLIAQATTSEVTEFLDACVQVGVNSLRVNLVEAAFVDRPQYSARNIAGDLAFTGTTFQSTLGSAYWDHVEWVIAQAASRGIVIWACPCYLGNGGGGEGWWGISGGAPAGMKQAGSTNIQTYGAAVGSRLNAHPNVVMVIGGDWWPIFDGSPSGAANVAVQNAMVTGLKSTDRAGRIYTAHGPRGTLSSDTDETWIDVDLAYTGESGQLHTEYMVQSGWAGGLPVFWGEGLYKHASIPPSDLDMRLQYWQALCWGACGQESSDEGLWAFGSANGYLGDVDWRDYINIPWWNHMAQVPAIMGSRPWYLTTPDLSHSVVTSGYGTVNTTGFVAVRASSSLVLGYTRNGATLTVARSNFSANFSAKKIDPTNGSVTVVASNQPNTGSQSYAFTGTNASGDSDWVVVMEVP